MSESSSAAFVPPFDLVSLSDADLAELHARIEEERIRRVASLAVAAALADARPRKTAYSAEEMAELFGYSVSWIYHEWTARFPYGQRRSGRLVFPVEQADRDAQFMARKARRRKT